MEKVIFINKNRRNNNSNKYNFPRLSTKTNPITATAEEVAVAPKVSPYKSGREEIEKEKAKSEVKLKNILQNAPNVLIKIRAIWPFDFFPDSIVVDQNKVDIIYRYFLEEGTFSVLIKNINSVHIHANVFFASLTFEVQGYETNPQPINFLNIEKAAKTRRIILGLIACDKQGVDISQIPAVELANKMEEIGKAHENTAPLITK